MLLQVLFACNSVTSDVTIEQTDYINNLDEVTGKFREDSYAYVEALRNTIRLDQLSAELDLQLPNGRVANSSDIVRTKVDESINELVKTKGAGFKEHANRTIASPKIQEFISAISEKSKDGKNRVEEVLLNSQKTAPTNSVTNFMNLRNGISKELLNYEKEVSKNGVHKNPEAEKAIKIAVDDFEKGVMNDKKLSPDDKKSLFYTSSFIFANARNMVDASIEVLKSTKENIKNGRVSGLWSSIIRILSTIITYVVAIGTIGVAIGAIFGPEGGAIGAGIGCVAGAYC